MYRLMSSFSFTHILYAKLNLVTVLKRFDEFYLIKTRGKSFVYGKIRIWISGKLYTRKKIFRFRLARKSLDVQIFFQILKPLPKHSFWLHNFRSSRCQILPKRLIQTPVWKHIPWTLIYWIMRLAKFLAAVIHQNS